MAYRFTNTDKWNDGWFSSLKANHKLLFLYLCDNCDIAGFIEVNIKRWASDLDTNKNEIEACLKGLERGLIFSESADCIYLKNFLKHQKNLPLNNKNMAHTGIIKRFDLYKDKFKFDTIELFIESHSKGLQCPYGIGTGKGSGKGNENLTWKNDFEIYKNDCRDGYLKLKSDKVWIDQQKLFYPNVDILKSIEKCFLNFWATEAGWKNKIKARTKDICWKTTIGNSLSDNRNKVYIDNGKSFKSESSLRKEDAQNLQDMAVEILQNAKIDLTKI